MTKMAESEIEYMDVDHEIMGTGRVVAYSDSAAPYDAQREMSINRSNRKNWEGELGRHQRGTKRNWKLVAVAEWVGGIAMILGFACLIVFAIRNVGHAAHQHENNKVGSSQAIPIT